MTTPHRRHSVVHPPAPVSVAAPQLAVVTRMAFVLLALAPVALSGQSTGTTIGIGFGPLTAYPAEFEGGGCDGSYVGFNVAARRSVTDAVAIEGSVAWTGSVATSCALALDALSMPAPRDGATYDRTSIDDDLRGETFWATRVGAVVTPWRSPAFTPHLRVAGGRLWSKRLWTWTAGAGLRYGFGRHAFVLDVERWSLAYDVTRETWIFRATALDELQSRDVSRESRRPWFLRVGWEFTVGR